MPYRDRRLDFWRGLCLIDMVIVHLYYQKVQYGDFLGQILGEYTRFAAGGFVFMAGMSIGAIFLQRATRQEQRWGTYRRLWGRSFKLLLWQYGTAVGWVALGLIRGSHAAEPSLGHFVSSILLLKDGDECRDLLPLYMVLVGLSPLFLELARRKWGWWLLGPVSIGVFVFGRYHQRMLTFYPDGAFAPMLWQIIFLAGLAAGCLLRKYDRIGVKPKLAIAGAGWIICLLIFWCEYGYAVGLPPCPLTPLFQKAPLTSAEMIRYLCAMATIISTTDLAWMWIMDHPLVEFAATLGRSTLPVYVGHLFLMELAGAFVGATWAAGAWQLLFIPLALGLLWLLAVGVQWRRTSPAQTWPALAAQGAAG